MIRRNNFPSKGQHDQRVLSPMVSRDGTTVELELQVEFSSCSDMVHTPLHLTRFHGPSLATTCSYGPRPSFIQLQRVLRAAGVVHVSSLVAV